MNFIKMVDCLPQNLCDDIVHKAEVDDKSFTPSTILVHKDSKTGGYRTSSNGLLSSEHQQLVGEGLNRAISLWSAEYAKFADFIPLPGVSANCSTWFEEPSFLRYREDQEYSWHIDAPLIPKGPEHIKAHERLISVVCYLNDNFEGGETEVIDTLFTPVKGKALIFPSNWCYPHRACPVSKGTKYAITTWYHLV